MMLKLPAVLDPLIAMLRSHGIRPVVVGGYLRDILMGNDKGKDVDLELYRLASLEQLSKWLAPYGKAVLVGKSFGVIKLAFEGFDIDFSQPRTENKSGSGHRGFDVTTYETLDFATAAKRRDFTINAMGFDLIDGVLLDPYNGLDDLRKRRLQCVDSHTFTEDPLRLFRALQFAARFHLHASDSLIALCRNMYREGALAELPKERIFDEMKKLLLAPRPSVGLKLMKTMDAVGFFPQLEALESTSWEDTLKMLDALTLHHPPLTLLLVALVHRMPDPNTCEEFLESFSFDKRLNEKVLKLFSHYQNLLMETNDGFVRRMALHVTIADLCLIASCDPRSSYRDAGAALFEHAGRLHVRHEKPVPILQGRHLIELGITPSVHFSTLLDAAFQAQLDGAFDSRKTGIEWIKKEKEKSD